MGARDRERERERNREREKQTEGEKRKEADRHLEKEVGLGSSTLFPIQNYFIRISIYIVERTLLSLLLLFPLA
jgi:hypothetical protein